MASLAYLHVRRLTPSLEGVVAKPVRSLYRPGERGWIKVKNRAYFELVLAAYCRECGVREFGLSRAERKEAD